MQAVEAACGVDGFTLMRRAGEAVARHARAMAPLGTRIVVLCGPGNNGGDGYVVAAALRAAGRAVGVHALGTPRGDAARAAALWNGPLDAAPEDGALVVDALFGSGLNRGMDGKAAALIARISAPVLAVDVPSGLDADTGAAAGSCVQATRTLSFHRRKPGHLLLPGRAFCGDVHLADIGIADAVTDLWANDPALWQLPVLAPDSHKYRRGACLVWSGPALATGASRLAAQAALRAGAGIVALAGARDALAEHAAQVTALLLRPAANPAETLADARFASVVVGPGAGPGARDAALSALSTGRAAVLDADALTMVTPAELAAARRGPLVLTPHEGEFARLFRTHGGSKLQCARDAARETGAVVLLKGADTVIAAPDGRAAINHNAPPWLATAGAGDVLAGIIGAYLAQGMPAWDAACAAAWRHGEAAQRAGPGMTAEDLLRA